MTRQTKLLSESLPHFAPMFVQNDGRGSATWRIMQWDNVSPDRVKPEHVHMLDAEYPNRTSALNASAQAVRQIAPARSGRTEKEHLGVWKWVQNGTVHYQSVMPVAPEGKHGRNGHKSTESQKKDAASVMLSVEGESIRLLRGIAGEDGKTLEAVLKEAIKEYDRQRYFAKADAAYEALRSDPKAWAEELEERKLWENTLLDGIDLNEIWHEDGTVTYRTDKEQKVA